MNKSSKAFVGMDVHKESIDWAVAERDGEVRAFGRTGGDLNAVARTVPKLVLGRRNYLFAGSDVGGERAANIYTLIATARLNDIDPYLYLRQVLERIAEHPINRIDELLPWNIAAKLDDERRQAA